MRLATPTSAPAARRLVWLLASTWALVAACHDPVRPDLSGARPSSSPSPVPAPDLAGHAWNVAAIATQPWELESPATNREIEGYASAPSVNKGESIQLFVNTASPTYSLAVYRMGWYGGAGAQLMQSRTDIPGTVQAPPIVDATTGLAECRWTNPVTVQTQDTWQSGVYLVKLTTTGGSAAGKSSYIIFVVRDDARAADFLFQVSINTYQAYNTWGGKSLYNGNSTGAQRAHKVSLNRPYALGDLIGAARYKGIGAGHFLATSTDNALGGWEYNTIRFLEREGYDVTYTTDYDVHLRPTTLLNHRGFLVVGHDEYWTMAQRRAIKNARDAGVSIGFFGANIGYWQVRFEASMDGVPGRTMVGYKDAALDPVKDSTATVLFRQVGRPEDRLIGVMYRGGFPVNSAIVIDDASTWVTSGTGLKPGDALPGLLGYEIDAMVTDTVITGIRRIAHSLWQNNVYGDMTVYTAPSGATVFATGSMQWAWGLDDYNVPDVRPSVLSAAAQQITRNVLNRFRGGAVAPAPVATVTTSLANANLLPGQITQATATLHDASGNVLTGRTVTWSSSNPSVATVSPTGLVTALTVGTANIVATSEGKTGAAPLTVTAPPPAPVATVSVTLATSSLLTGGTTTATATLRDASGAVLTGRAVTWSSSNTAVATVSSTGLVTAVAPGAATITATSEGKSGDAALTVAAPIVPVATIAVTLGSSSVQPGQTTQATATLRDASGNVLTGRTVTWSSSNTAVATVSATGVVTAVAAGTADITASSEGKSGSALLTVPASVATVSVAIADATLQVGQTAQATATLRDAGGTVLTGRPVTWTSSNTAVATVSSSGLVTGVGAGAATITATSEGKTGTVDVTVSAPVATVGVTLAATTLLTGQTTTATATLRDAGGTVLTGRTVTWSSSNAAVATVSPTGVVTAVGGGTASITATSEGKTGSASLTVTAPVATVGVTLASSTLQPGQTTQATATLRDAAGNVVTGYTVTWSSSNSSVATVSATGLVTAVGSGTASVQATASTPGTSTSAVVTGAATLTVSAPIAPVATIAVSIADASLQTQQTAQATATLRDAGGNVLTGRTVTWSSSNTSVATVSSTGLVTGVGIGSATITATSEGKTGSVAITVSATVATVSVAIGDGTLRIGQATQATATLRNGSGSVVTRPIAWSSSNTAVATVSPTGQVTGRAKGTATITATSEGKTGSASVKVTAAVASVSVSITDATLQTGQTAQATATPRDANGDAVTDATVSWSSSNTAVATVSTSGVVTAKSAGSATITATSEGRSGTVSVTVSLTPVASVSVSIADATIVVGQTSQATVRLRDASGNILSPDGRTITWSSSNTSRATVSSSGLVTAVGAGSVTITAATGGRSDGVGVTISVPVTASFVYDCEKRTCSFNAQASTGASSYRWEFGDGDVVTDNDPRTSHTYDNKGDDKNRTYTVKLTVTGPGGSGSVSRTITCKGGKCS